MLSNFSPTFLTVLLILIPTLLIVKKLVPRGVCKITKDVTGQVIVITGANTGIGKETAKTLAKMNGTVILACRDAGRTLPVVEQLKKQTKNPNIEFMQLDLADISSIENFVQEFKKKYNKLHILINNAGVMMLPERKLTKDGFEMQFGTNHLGHFYLTKLLLDVIEKSGPSRIINVSSNAHLGCKEINWDDLMYENGYKSFVVYNHSKMANVLFTKGLQKRLKGKNVKVVSLHPGVVRTELTRYMREKWYFVVLTTILAPFIFIFGKSPVEGAQTTLYCALEDQDKLNNGFYYADCKSIKENPLASDPENAKRLWELSEQLLSKVVKK